MGISSFTGYQPKSSCQLLKYSSQFSHWPLWLSVKRKLMPALHPPMVKARRNSDSMEPTMLLEHQLLMLPTQHQLLILPPPPMAHTVMVPTDTTLLPMVALMAMVPLMAMVMATVPTTHMLLAMLVTDMPTLMVTTDPELRSQRTHRSSKLCDSV